MCIRDSFSLDITAATWVKLIIFSLLAINLYQLSYLQGVKKVPTVAAGIIMLLEPVTGAVLASIFLDQQLTLNIIIGGLIILLANYLVITKGNDKKTLDSSVTI